MWEVRTGTAEREPFGVTWVGLSPDGKRIVARFIVGGKQGRSEERVAAWDAATRAQVFDIRMGGWDASVMLGGSAGAMSGPDTCLFPSGTQLDFRDSSRSYAVKLADGKKTPTAKPDAMAVWADPSTQASLWLISNLEEYALVAGKVVAEELGEHAFVAGELEAGSAGRERSPVDAFTRTKSRSERYRIRAAGASTDLKRLAMAGVVGDERFLTLFEVTADKTVKLTEVAASTSHRDPVSVIRFSPDGRVLATGGQDGKLHLWNTAVEGTDWKPQAALMLGNFTVSCLAFSPDGRMLACTTYDKRPNLYLIDVIAKKTVGQHRLGDRGLSAVAFSPDGKRLVTGDSLGMIRGWDAAALRD